MNFTLDQIVLMRKLIAQRVFVLEHHYAPIRSNVEELDQLRFMDAMLEILISAVTDTEEPSESVGPR
jgi:hypothetical protein